MDRNTRNLILEVSAGIVLFAAIAMVVALFFFPERTVFAGLLLGMVLALAMFLSMALTLEGAVKTKNSKSIQRRTVLGAVIRYVLLFTILMVVVVRLSDLFNPIAVIVGIFGFKAGAFLQPVIHKITGHKAKKE
ncbi:MAG: ATP synthase subunit I [Lacrimispora sp.]